MKVIIAGSRSYEGSHVSMIAAAVARSGFEVTEVVSGGATGIDTMGETWADDNDIPYTRHKPDWNGHPERHIERNGRSYDPQAAFDRNHLMGDLADALIAIWDGTSGGTNDMVKYMKSLGKPIYVCRPHAQ